MRKGGNKKIGLVTLTIIITHGYTFQTRVAIHFGASQRYGHITIDWDGFGFLQMHPHVFSAADGAWLYFDTDGPQNSNSVQK